jgi:hypothetical protein
MQQLEDYILEMEADVEFDDFSIKDSQMKLPAIKHKWVGRLIRHKNNLNKIKAERHDLVKRLAIKIKETSPYKVTDASAERASYKHEDVAALSKTIQESELIIEFIEKADKILNSMTFDIKNLVEIMKLETL